MTPRSQCSLLSSISAPACVGPGWLGVVTPVVGGTLARLDYSGVWEACMTAFSAFHYVCIWKPLSGSVCPTGWGCMLYLCGHFADQPCAYFWAPLVDCFWEGGDGTDKVGHTTRIVCLGRHCGTGLSGAVGTGSPLFKCSHRNNKGHGGAGSEVFLSRLCISWT